VFDLKIRTIKSKADPPKSVGDVVGIVKRGVGIVIRTD